MKYARWRIPLIFAILLVYCCLYFTGNNWTVVRAFLLSLQLTPSIAHIGLPLAIAAVIAIITLFFGRVYCSLLCPAGLVQDLLARGGRWFGLSRLRYARPGKPVLLLGVVALAGILGATGIVVLLDPLGLFGRLALPVGNWYRYWSGETGDWYRYGGIGWIVLIAGAILLVLAPLVKGRWFCDRLCPVGALLGLICRLRGKRVTIDSGKCVACGQCGTVCPARCANPQEKRIEHERCVECFECTAVCKFSAITYATPETVPGRRDFFRAGAAAVAGGAYVFSRGLSGHFSMTTNADAGDSPAIPVTPPGSAGNKRHKQRCVGCQACVLSCPVGIIRPHGANHRPVLDYEYGYCQYNCLDCSASCPAGVFQPLALEEKHNLRIAATELKLERCVVKTQGTACGACAEVCPTHAVSMAAQGGGLPTVPDFDAAYCIGCGACYHVCPAEPRAFVITGLDKHETSQGVRPFGHESPEISPSSDGTAEDGELMDFPF